MADDTVRVQLTGGGPLDGETQEHDRSELGDDIADWGTMMVVDGPRAHPPDPGARAHYAPDEGGDPHVWLWQGWVP